MNNLYYYGFVIFSSVFFVFFMVAWFIHRNSTRNRFLHGELLTYFRIGNVQSKACYRIRIANKCIYLNGGMFGGNYKIPLDELVEVSKVERGFFEPTREFKWRQAAGNISLDKIWSDRISELLKEG